MAQEYRFGEIVLVDYPFSDGVRSKWRPGLVLSSHLDGDVLIARITSTPRESANDIALDPSRDSGLMASSVVRIDKLATLLPNLIEKKIGHISLNDRLRVLSALHAFIESIAQEARE
jgi:mRNA interferase MazF